MTDNGVYLDKLTLFGHLLREDGLFVTPGETEAAVKLLKQLNLSDRATVKAALCAVYAHSREEQERFDRCFDSFFLTEDQIRAIERARLEQQKKQREAAERASSDPETARQLDGFNQAQRDAYAALPEEEKARLKQLSEKYLGEQSRNPELYGSFIHSVFAKSIMEQQLLMEDAGTHVMASDPELGILYRDIGTLRDTELPKAVGYLQSLAARLSGELSRGRSRHSRDRAVDFKRTIRKGLETGGSLYRIVRKRKRSRRRQMILLCDVSASMIRFSEFALRFIRLMDQTSDSSRVFLFSETVIEADPFRLQNMETFRSYVRDSGIYGRGTDLGGALQTLNGIRPALLGPATVLLVLSDGKTTDRALAVRELKQAKTAAGQVFFLNPIPENKWKYSGSIEALNAVCPMFPCSTLDELGAACRKVALKKE